MGIYNLPAVDYDPLPEPTEFGEWTINPDLAGVSKALKVNVDALKIGRIKSIPDAWAQIRVFSQSLMDLVEGDLHDQVVAQWRGLLATFALQPMFNLEYDLEVAGFDLAHHPEAQHRFRRVLRDLQPTIAVAPGLSWERGGVVLLRPKAKQGLRRPEPIPLAILSPWTLLAAGKTAPSIAVGHVPWLAAGLADPLATGGLSSDQWFVLAEYLKALHTSMGEAGGFNHRLQSRLRELIEVYHDEVLNRIREEPAIKLARINCDWPHPFYAALGGTWTIDEAKIPSGDSRCALAIRPETRSMFNGVILADQAITAAYGLPAEQIRLFERFSLRDAASPELMATIKKEAAAKGFLVIEPDDLLVPTLVRFADTVAIPGHPISFLHSLLPISPIVLLLLDRDQLQSNITLEDRGAVHEVRLTLPLAPDANGKLLAPQHTVVRRYDESAVKKEEPLADLSIWPDFKAHDWTWTFLRFQYNPNYELRPRFALSAEFLLADAQARGPSPEQQVRGVLEWAQSMAPDARLGAEAVSEVKDAAGKLLLQRLRFAKTNDGVGEVQRLPRGAEAIFLARGEKDGTVRPVGCVVVRPKTSAIGAGDAEVAIDFGTTNTVAYIKRGDSLETVKFSSRVMFPLQRPTGTTEEDLVWPYVDFFPLTEQATPFPTVAKRRKFEGEISPALARALVEGHDTHGVSDNIFFVPPFEKIDTGIVSQSGDLIFDIKWRREDYIRNLTRRFLRQVMMMASAELVGAGIAPGAIKFKFSFPQAFSRDERDHFKDYVQNAWRDLFGDLPNIGLEPGPRIAFETEGEAAARYFKKDEEQKQTSVGNLLLMLDIGGGTTDIAIWHKENLRWRGSYRVAGGDFFTRFLANNIDILSKINFDEAAEFVKGSTRGEVDAARFVELFVSDSRFADNFNRSYPGFAQGAEGQALRLCASVALAGLLHYMGLVIRHLVDDAQITEEEVVHLAIALGGRGSAFFRQLHRGGDEDSNLARLCGVLYAAAGYNPETARPTITFSKMPKHEVARGLLISEDQRNARPPPPLWKVAPAGGSVSYTAEGVSAQLSQGEDLSKLLKADSVDSVELDEFKTFLKNLYHASGIHVDIDSRNGQGAKLIKQKTATALREAARGLTPDDLRRGDAQAFAPPFITALRLLIDILNQSVRERDKMIEVSETQR